MVKLSGVRKELLEEIIEKIGSFAITDCELNEATFEDSENGLIYDIKLDCDSVFVVFHKESLTIIKDDRSLVIDNKRFYQCLIQ